jgi:rhodanese-related sulfurtransferase
MKRWVLTGAGTILLVVSLGAAGCREGRQTRSSEDVVEQSRLPVRKVSPSEAKALIDRLRDRPDFVILDVRTPEEYRSGHLPGSRMLNYRSPAFRDSLARMDRSVTYLVYCRSGHRSGEATRIMASMGFQKVYDLQGGILSWNAQGLPLER